MEQKGVRVFSIKRNVLIVALFGIAFLLMAISFLLPKLLSPTGLAPIVTGTATLEVLDFIPLINITHPLNITYNYSIGTINFPLDLNVTSKALMVFWNYSLYDLRHDKWDQESIGFTPNDSFDAVRWGNRLAVSAVSSSGTLMSDNVSFFVFVPNSAPIITGIPSNIYVCEGSTLFHLFSSYDVDEDNINGFISNTSGWFFLFKVNQNLTSTNFVITSSLLPKNATGGAVRNGPFTYDPSLGAFTYNTLVDVVEVSTLELYSDNIQANITVIERNNPPFIDHIEVKTLVWNQGPHSTLYAVTSISYV